MDQALPALTGPRCTLVGRLALALALLGVPACRLAEAGAPAPAQPPAARTFEVEEVRDVPYYRGPGADARHRLDLFVPKGERDYPVVLLVHGGAWMIGDKSCCGLYSAVGRCLARHGVGAALPGYRLSPCVKHPEHVRDVARAFAWTRRNIARYGGDPDQLFVAGHSAGGHLVALLATDESYLEAEGVPAGAIKGVIAVSGVYRIPAASLEVTLGGAGPCAFRLDELLPLPAAWDRGGVRAAGGIPLTLNFFGPVFGDDPAVRAAASPVNHVRPGLPPFLLLSAEKDLPYLPGMAEEFCRGLVANHCEARLLKVMGRNHNTIMLCATTPEDPVARAMLEFVHQHAH